jgi:hypothetical protein
VGIRGGRGVAGGSRHARLLREHGTGKKRNRGVRWVFLILFFFPFSKPFFLFSKRIKVGSTILKI